MKLNPNTISEKMKSVKASCGGAPFGEKRTQAWRHYNAAEAAHKANDDIKTKYELEAARKALA
ncbi:hypothetical protein Q8W37_19105 [Shimia thalassica]|jgi:hypothetical protein|uniref:hypothetical protein n=1 Tax=Shimia thalassica TaxID=1715693 RepID=UPI0026E2E1C8|nr:hypothetical protein [Shimia thalassica]MDO6522944.1 hypothetical protein [Shimia thalassica]MDP2520569.1 hypothetical protein [Shimia thalassica]MDP2582055.1 hypothetical protein [Shimia thalassica]